uniref:cytochrome c oxidase subunit II n=1 Tax=Xestocephalus limpidissimus TaxID=3112140 RepID=UPI002E7A45BC|nr:cytochrome c oxidase subunit II [Xestocephalus limpidissimus]WRK21325.1 cytochrome c oxidase subunit II [Xestocephalus limpidissimus]
MSTWMNINFMNSASPIMEQLIMFNDHAMMIITIIMITVSYMMLTLFMNKMINRNLLESQTIELVWTIMPAIMLVFIAMPSLQILYMIEETNNPLITVKTMGHQWYWSYEYSDMKKIEFESYMKPNNFILNKEFRVLETDNHIILPFNTQIRMLMSSTDVIHSWTIQSIGIKMDASPGRINQSNIMINRSGMFYGQCSEICGSNHTFMPISLESINMKSFLKWMNNT